jgi:hypothetical protein
LSWWAGIREIVTYRGGRTLEEDLSLAVEDKNESIDSAAGTSTLSGGWWQPDEPERRAHPRVAFLARVNLVSQDSQTFTCEAVDLGVGGMFLQTTRVIPEEGQLVEIELPAEAVTFDAEVVRQDTQRFGFAVRFINLDTRLRAVLQRLIEEQERSAEP